MQSPPSPSGRASVPSTLRRTRGGRITRGEQTCNLQTIQMGQSTSSQQQDSRDNSGSFQRQSGSGSRQGNEASPETSHLRRSRRIRNTVSHFVGSTIGSMASGGVTTDSSPSTTRSSSLRLRNRVMRLSNRSPITATSSSPRPSRFRIPLPSISRSPPSTPSMPSMPSPSAVDTPPLPISGEDPFMGVDDPMDLSPVTPIEPPRPDPPPVVTTSPTRRSRMSRVLAEIGAARSSGSSSRRNSQAFRNPPGIFDSPDSDIDGEMELDTPPSSNIGTGSSSSRSGRPDFSSLSNPSQGSLSDNLTRARPGEDQSAMLSRLLSVAAAMTAASLVGSNQQALTEAQDVAGDSGNNSFESFLHALQSGNLATALRNGGNEMGGGAPDNADANTAPLNFFRMFRFGASPPTTADMEPGETTQTRMVPVIIVGIRSVTPRDNVNHNNNAPPTPPFFDALANLPMTPTIGANRGTGSRSRLMSSQRRASVGAVGGEGSRLQRRATRPASEILLPSLSRSSDTPQGPYAPPSTPADPASPLFSSGTLPRRGSGDAAHLPEQTARHAADRDTSRSRRHSTPPLSHGEPASSSAAGGSRNSPVGSTGNNNTPNHQRRQEGTRSWIIYVLGGSYPENHPILTTPSLFTDTPTYEDMMLLSSLLGPAKPPVASQEDVNSAGGLFTVGDTDYIGEDGTVRRLQEGDRCLVCLCDFEKGEQCRSLVQCQHIFHKECIDEWLTTGRNSCPLCRAQGVKEKEKGPRSQDANAQPTATVNIS